MLLIPRMAHRNSAGKSTRAQSAATPRRHKPARLYPHGASRTRRRSSSALESFRTFFGSRLASIGQVILFPIANQADPFGETLKGRVLAYPARVGVWPPKPV